MKKVVFFALGLVVLVFSFSLGRVSAKNGWDCLYGNCNKDKFIIANQGDIFFMGEAKYKGNNSAVWKSGIFKNKNSLDFQYLVTGKSFVKMNESNIAFGHIGENSDGNACISKGYVFKMDLSSYDKYADKGCEPLGGAK